MVVGTELQALKAISERGGQTTTGAVAKDIGCSSDYARIICRSLGTADYIDLRSNGACEITAKGRRELGGSEVHAKG